MSINAMEYFDSIAVQTLLTDVIWNNDICVESMAFLLCRLVLGCEPSQVTALQFINIIKMAGDVENLANVKNGYVCFVFIFYFFIFI